MLALLGVVAGLTLAQQTDTTVAVQQGARLEVENFGGEIVVRAWNQNRVRVRASHSSRDVIDVSVSTSVVSVEAESRHGPAHLVEYEISVPTWMAVELSGVSTDMVVEGTAAAVHVETVEGEVKLTGGAGEIDLSSVEGNVTASGVRGRLSINSVDGDVHVTDVQGDITIESVDGDIVIGNVQSAMVDVNTVDGDILYQGTIRDNGRYALTTHDGTVIMSIPEGTNATITVASFEGEFDASFPLQLQNVSPKRRFSFTLGSGGARVELETFDGEILLRRPTEIRIPPVGESVEDHQGRRHDDF